MSATDASADGHRSIDEVVDAAHARNWTHGHVTHGMCRICAELIAVLKAKREGSGHLEDLLAASHFLLGTIEAIRVESERALKTPLPIIGLSDFELALTKVEEELHG